MKKLGNKSLSSFLGLSLNIIWWIEWILCSAILSVLLIVSIVKNELNLSVPVTFASVDYKKIGSQDNSIPGAHLELTNGNISFPIHTDLPNILLLITGFALFFSVVILITYQLKLIFSSFVQQQPFHERNIPRIRKIGIILIIFSFLQFLFRIVLTQFLITHFKWEDGIVLTYSFNISCLITGVILIIIAEIFKLGSSLEEESKLTV